MGQQTFTEQLNEIKPKASYQSESASGKQDIQNNANICACKTKKFKTSIYIYNQLLQV